MLAYDTVRVGKRISDLRKSRLWTQAELAERVNASDKTVSKWETGLASPGVEMFPLLSKIFGVSIDYLFGGAGVTTDNTKETDLCVGKKIQSYIVIRLYRNQIDEDCHDIHMDDFKKRLLELEKYAESIGRRLFFLHTTSDFYNGVPVELAPLAEIEYTGELSIGEKEELIRRIKYFSLDGEHSKKGIMTELYTLTAVKFKRVCDEIIEL